uniref:Insulinase family protein n=1 Tax=Desertifilum tharense IPPAS B-1220 TaxID=1781255 RepID=A0ACD5H190_9CYAN
MYFLKCRSSRLYQSLVETGLASEVSGSANHLTHQGWYRLQAILTADRSAREGIEAIDRAIAKLQTQGVTPRNWREPKPNCKRKTCYATAILPDSPCNSATIKPLPEIILGAIAISRYVNQVSAADIQRVAQTYLQPSARTVGFLQPTGLPSTAIESASAYAAPENFNLATGTNGAKCNSIYRPSPRQPRNRNPPSRKPLPSPMAYRFS